MALQRTSAKACASTCGSRSATTSIADDTYSVVNGEVHRRIALSDPGIDDYRNELLWCPESPTLDSRRSWELWADRGDLLDMVWELYGAPVRGDSARPRRAQ